MRKKVLNVINQNVRGLRTKAGEFFTSVAGGTFDIIAVTETGFQEDSLMADYFVDCYKAFRADKSYELSGKRREGGALIAVKSELNCCRRRDLERYNECVWIELKLKDGCNLLIGNHYFSPDTVPDVMYQYFSELEMKLNVGSYRVFCRTYQMP